MDIEDRDIQIFQETIRESSTYDFNDYSVNSLKRRISKVLEDHKTDLLSLNKRLRADADFLEEIVKDITVNTTELFRDPQIWKKLLYQVLPRYKHLASINIWHPGCSTGQEVYSMMMILDHMGMLDRSNIYASDINEDVLELAKKGVYRYRFNKNYILNYDDVFSSAKDSEGNSRKPDSKKYFKIDETRDLIIMQDKLRKKPVYKINDLVKNKNLFNVKFDVIICRNVIIYFNYELQNRILKLFHDNLHPNGCLLLGMHESIIGPFSHTYIKDGHFYFRSRESDNEY
jgi:chemotaxis protein methyltransferase CheR